MHKNVFVVALLPLALIAAACTTDVEVEEAVEATLEVPESSAAVATEPRELNLLVGSGRDTEAILEFFPRDSRVRLGDTGTWKINSDEIHTVSFLPEGAPVKEFPVAAIDVPLPMLGGTKGKMYILEEDKAAVLSGSQVPEPLVLHVNVGDCVNLLVTNETAAGPVSVHADMLAYDPNKSMGISAGANPPQTVASGGTRTYTFYAHPDVGESVAMLRDWGNVLENPGLGLYGAIVVGPAGSSYTHPMTGEDMSRKSGWRVDVHPPSQDSYRDFALFIQDQDELIGTHIMPYSEEVEGVVGLNYQFEPLGARLARDEDTSRVFSSGVHGDPNTPVLEAISGDPVRIHVLVPFSEQSHVFTLEGHPWPVAPGMDSSDILSAVQVGTLEAITIQPKGGAGGRPGLPGDYLYGDHREPYRQAGLWGLFRVLTPEDAGGRIQPLPGR